MDWCICIIHHTVIITEFSSNHRIGTMDKKPCFLSHQCIRRLSTLIPRSIFIPRTSLPSPNPPTAKPLLRETSSRRRKNLPQHNRSRSLVRPLKRSLPPPDLPRPTSPLGHWNPRRRKRNQGRFNRGPSSRKDNGNQ
jgi:hypothetical protein